MRITDMAGELAAKNLDHPDLSLLSPNQNPYSISIYQPSGEVEASSEGVYVRDDPNLVSMGTQFIRDAHSAETELVIAPEYSLAIDETVSLFEDGVLPSQGCLWILGCESILQTDLPGLVERLESFACVIVARQDQRNIRTFLDPVLYVFVTTDSETRNSVAVVTLQFKTQPMGNSQFPGEVNQMTLGSEIFRFGDDDQIKLVTLICSDVIDIDTRHIKSIYENTLVVHIQMNSGYRNAAFRAYRDVLFGQDCDRTELICANWSRPTLINGQEVNDLGGSAWYLKPTGFEDSDQTLDERHRGGLYYSWLRTGFVHALFLNRHPGIYRMLASKVSSSSGAVYRRKGPMPTVFLAWDKDSASWQSAQPDSNFEAFVENFGDYATEIRLKVDKSPMALERIVDLSCGRVNVKNWHSVKVLESTVIDQSEVIGLHSYCQDEDVGSGARREGAFRMVRRLRQLIDVKENLPVPLKDLAGAAEFDWSAVRPHQNLKGPQGRATVVYLGETASAERARDLCANLEAWISKDIEELDSKINRSRLLVLRVDDGELVLHRSAALTQIDNPDFASGTDFAKES